MKKTFRIIFFLLLLLALYAGWNFLGPTVSAPEGKYLFIHTGATYEDVKTSLKEQHILSGTFFFDKAAGLLKYKDHVKPGRYEIKNNSSILSLIRMLKSGNQSPVKFVINKLRTKEDLASRISNNFECDSAQVMAFLTDKDSLDSWRLDSNTVMTAVIPNTYEILWNSSFKKIFGKFKKAEEIFWNDTRLKKAAEKNMSPLQVYTLASIVEEETTKPEDKGPIASVYLNRYRAGQRLQADPTVKYAMRNFALKRIYESYLKFESPYNTYIHTGFPPGPICTPSTKTLDAVLDAPATNYMYFVAKPELNGYSNFASTYPEHLIFAKAYQKALDSMWAARNTTNGQ